MPRRKPEQQLWDDLREVMDGHWTPDRVENRVALNMPDLWFRFGGKDAFTGWIELKQIFRWAHRRTEPTRVPNLTSGQKKWLIDNHKAGANTWLLLHIRLTNEYLFIPGDEVLLIGDITQAEVYSRAYEIFHGLPTASTIREILATKGRL